jgi:uncharacterized membrane protein
MNTIFKFYNQAWVLFAVSSAAMLYAMFDRLVPAASMRTREVETAAAPIAESMERGVAATLTPSAAALAEFGPAVTTVTSARPVLAADGNGHAPYPVDGDGVAEPDGPAVIPPPPPSRTRGIGRRGLPASWSRPLRLFERYPWWSTALVALLLASLVYTYGGTMNRESFRTMWLPQNSVPLTLDGAAFMKVSYPQDYAGIQWLNAHVSGAPVIAEAHAPQNGYTWPSRVSMFTGLPDIINGIHEGEQRYQDELDPSVNCTDTRNPGQCAITHASRDADLTTLYSSPFGKDKWRIIRKYGVKYIFVGFSESHCIQDVCYSKAGLAAFKGMLGHGLKVAFHAPGVTIYEVTR